MNKTVTAEL